MLNFAVGPVEMEEEILKIGSEQIPYFRTEEFSNLMKENEKLLLKSVNAPENSRVIFFTASGTGAMEATIMNTFDDTDRVLIVNGGGFGERFKEICDIHNIANQEIKLLHNEDLTTDHLSQYSGKDFSALLINIHETSTGVLYDIEIVRKFCQENNLLLIVDAISSFLADPFDMKSNSINATILSSQKALALPPGISFVIIDSIMYDRIKKKKSKSIYFDFKNYLKNGERGQTPFTPAVSILLQLNRKLKKIDLEGVENVVHKVSLIAKDFRKKLQGFPLEIPLNSQSNALTAIRPKGKMKANEIFLYLKNNYGIFVVPNGGELSETLFRVGHIGNLSIKDNDILIKALSEMNDEGLL